MTHNPTHVGCDPILAVVIVIVVVLQKKITGGIYYTITEGTSEGTKEKKINIYYLYIILYLLCLCTQENSSSKNTKELNK